jgi:hypothetical protein
MPRACQEFVFGERNGEERKRKVIKFLAYRVGFTKIVLAMSSVENKLLSFVQRSGACMPTSTSEACTIKIFITVIYTDFCNKLECLSLASLFNLV